MPAARSTARRDAARSSPAVDRDDVAPGEGGQVDGAERAAEHGRRHEQAPVVAVERRQPLLHQVACAGRERGEVACAPVLGQQLGDLSDQEGIAGGQGDHPVGQVGAARRTELAREQRADVAPVEPRQGHPLGASTEPGERRAGRDVGVAIGADDEYGPRRHVGGDHVEQLQGPLVGPVQVVEHEERRAFGGGLFEGVEHRCVRRGPRRRGGGGAGVGIAAGE